MHMGNVSFVRNCSPTSFRWSHQKAILMYTWKKGQRFCNYESYYKVRLIANFSLQWIRAIHEISAEICITSLRLLPECHMSIISGDWLAGKLQLISVTRICGRKNNHNFFTKNTATVILPYLTLPFNFIAGLAPIFHLPVCDLGTT